MKAKIFAVSPAPTSALAGASLQAAPDGFKVPAPVTPVGAEIFLPAQLERLSPAQLERLAANELRTAAEFAALGERAEARRIIARALAHLNEAEIEG